VPQTCKACSSLKREEIDRAILAGEPNRRIATRCDASEAAIRRHAAHVPATVALAVRAEEATRADDLLGILREGVADARRLRAKAEDEGDYRAAIAAVKALSDIVETLARVAERLAKKESDLASSPEWIDLRTRLLDTLERFPDALEAVSRAMGPARGDAR